MLEPEMTDPEVLTYWHRNLGPNDKVYSSTFVSTCQTCKDVQSAVTGKRTREDSQGSADTDSENNGTATFSYVFQC